jgi:hypothetical protein
MDTISERRASNYLYRVSLANVGTLQGRPRRSSRSYEQDQGRIPLSNCNMILSDQVLSL